MTELHPNSAVRRSVLPSAMSQDLAFSKRAPIILNGATCSNHPQYGDGAMFSQGQMEFLAECACNAFASATPGIWGMLGMYISSASCNNLPASGLCNVVVTVLAAQAGVYVQLAF